MKAQAQNNPIAAVWALINTAEAERATVTARLFGAINKSLQGGIQKRLSDRKQFLEARIATLSEVLEILRESRF